MDKMGYVKEINPLNEYFYMLEKSLKYRNWYFGHFIDDIDLDEKHTMIYKKMIRIL